MRSQLIPLLAALCKSPARLLPWGPLLNSIVVDPTGSFAYMTATTNPNGSPFAQILGFSIDGSSGIPTQFPAALWTDSQTSNGSQLGDFQRRDDSESYAHDFLAFAVFCDGNARSRLRCR